MILAQLDTFYATAEEDCAELAGDKILGQYLYIYLERKRIILF